MASRVIASIVNLRSTRQHEVGSECWSETSRRILGDVGKFAPRLEPGCELFAINRRAQLMALECEMLPYRPEAKEEFLCAFRVAKTAHASLAFACRLVAVLGSVVEASSRFHEHVLDVRQFRDLTFRRCVAAQLIGDDLARYWV